MNELLNEYKKILIMATLAHKKIVEALDKERWDHYKDGEEDPLDLEFLGEANPKNKESFCYLFLNPETLEEAKEHIKIMHEFFRDVSSLRYILEKIYE